MITFFKTYHFRAVFDTFYPLLAPPDFSFHKILLSCEKSMKTNEPIFRKKFEWTEVIV